MAANQEYSEIKAGVAGLAGDAPSPDDAPSAPEAPQSEVAEAPETVESPSIEVAPQPSPFMSQPSEPMTSRSSSDNERIHEIAEAIINERWEEFLGRVGDLAVWKEKAETNIISVKQELIRTQERFDNLQNAVLGKVREYDHDMREVNTEMKALEKVLERITEPLVMNIKELNRLTTELKQKH